METNRKRAKFLMSKRGLNFTTHNKRKLVARAEQVITYKGHLYLLEKCESDIH